MQVACKVNLKRVLLSSSCRTHPMYPSFSHLLRKADTTRSAGSRKTTNLYQLITKFGQAYVAGTLVRPQVPVVQGVDEFHLESTLATYPSPQLTLQPLKETPWSTFARSKGCQHLGQGMPSHKVNLTRARGVPLREPSR